MRILGFTFKTEAKWIFIFSLAPAIIALFLVLIGIFVGNLLRR